MALNTSKRDTNIRSEVKEMMLEKSERGVKKYKESYIYDVVASRYGLAARTVANIWKYGNKGSNNSP